MGCIEMYNSENKGATMSPRISFSNDFVESHSQAKQERRPRSDAPISTDFEFSVSNNNSLQLTTADELFFKGRILPMKEHHPFHRPTSSSTTTLRDELLAGDGIGDVDGANGFSGLNKPPLKGRWKGLLGLRKVHIGSKKTDSNAHKQGMMSEGGGTSAADMEMKM